jgi:threonyl-tRNA synthetase
MLVVGAKEAETETVSYRDRVDGDRGAMPLAEAVSQLKAESDARKIRTVAPLPTPPPGEERGEDHSY